ncbi:50S ribosomal protein L35 [Planctomycetales bacterium ZRK34]|nr:50S ribosomal protein L35 [Planctomycetales bacterium ZRK34]
MPKCKSHKGTLKRIKVTGGKKLKHKRMGTSHLMSSMNGKKVRHLRRPLVVAKPIAKMMERVLHTRLVGRDPD